MICSLTGTDVKNIDIEKTTKYLITNYLTDFTSLSDNILVKSAKCLYVIFTN